MLRFLNKLTAPQFYLLSFGVLFSFRLIYLFSIQPGNAPDEVGHMIMALGFANGRYVNLEESFRLSHYPYSIYNPLGYFPSAFFLWLWSHLNISVLEISDPFFFSPIQNTIARVGMQFWTFFFLLFFLNLIQKTERLIQLALICAVALIPQLIFVQSYLNLDSIGLTVFLYLLWAIQSDREHHLAFGSFLLACCKMNFFCLGVVPVGFWFWKYRSQKAVFFRKLLLYFLIPFSLGFSWFVFSYWVNTRQHGSFLGFNALGSIYNSSKTGGFRIFSLNFINISLNSAFGRFGWMQVRYPEPVYFLWRVVFLPAGLYATWKAFKTGPLNSKLYLAAGIGLLIVILNISSHFWASFTNDYQPQGRYLLPTVMILQTFLVWFLTLTPRTPKKLKALMCVCGITALSAVFGVLLAKKTIPNPPGLRTSSTGLQSIFQTEERTTNHPKPIFHTSIKIN